jgi:O-antigen/teichoic acid export membrane protein
MLQARACSEDKIRHEQDAGAFDDGTRVTDIRFGKGWRSFEQGSMTYADKQIESSVGTGRALDRSIPRWRQRLAGLLADGFARNVLATFTTRIVLIVIGLVTTILVARILGPVGRGLFAVATAIGNIGLQFGTLGLHTSNVYFVSKDRATLPKLLGNSLVVSCVIGILALVGCYSVFAFLPQLAPLHGSLLLLGLLWIPVGTAYLLVQNLLLGVNEVATYNSTELGNRGLALVVIIFLAFTHWLSPELAFGAGLIAMTLMLAVIVAHLSRVAQATPRPSLSLFVANLAYGLRAYFGAFLCFLVLRLDLLLVKYLRGAESAGYYSIAVAMTDYIAILPTVVASLLLPKLSATEDIRQKYIQMKKTLLVTVAIVTPLLAFSAVLAPWVVRVLFGKAFAPSVSAYLWLMPGILFLSIHTVSVQFLNSIGYPMSVVWIWLGCAVLNIGLNMIWAIPALGMDGAAITSSLCYIIAASLILAVIWRELQNGSKETPVLGEAR